MKNLKKMLVLCSLALVFTAVLADASYAEVGAFGLIGIAFQAIFGKVKWTWFAGLAVGLAILAAAGAIVNYATGGNINAGQTGDTFSQSADGL